MKNFIRKSRYLNIFLLLLLVFNLFSFVTHLSHNGEIPAGTQGDLHNYKVLIIAMLIIELILLLVYWPIFVKINIFGKILYILSLIFIMPSLKLTNFLFAVGLKRNHPYIFSLMQRYYPLGIIISIAIFILLSSLSNIWFTASKLKKRVVEK